MGVIKAKRFDDQQCAESDESETEDRQDRALQKAETKARGNEDDASSEPDQENRIDGAEHRLVEEGRQKLAKGLAFGRSPVLPSWESGFALQRHNSTQSAHMLLLIQTAKANKSAGDVASSSNVARLRIDQAGSHLLDTLVVG